MASAFAHATVAAALGQAAPPSIREDWRFWYMAVLCSVLPDADVAGFRFGVRYGDLWGHRGVTHSLFFAAAVGFVAAARFARPPTAGWRRKEGWYLACLFAAITASHGILDAFTNGGLGIAFFSPFVATRYFFPWRPIEVSPIGAQLFFSATGLKVLRSELFYVGPPAVVLGLALRLFLRHDPAATRS